MAIIKPSKEWKEYIKFTDTCLNANLLNQYTVSNFFLHPIRPSIETNRILKNLKNISIFYKLRLRIKFYISFLKTIFTIFKGNKEKTTIDNMRGIYKKNYDVIFISHLLNEKQLELSIDNYYGDLINYTSKKGLSVLLIFLPHLKSNKEVFTRFLKKNNGYDTFILDQNFISFKAKIKTLISLLKERQKFLRLSRNLSGYDKNLALYTAESYLSKNNFCNLIYGLQTGDIIKNTKSKNLVTTYEGFSWERLFYYFSRKNNPFINCIGFQHTIIFKYQHSLTRSLRKEWNPNLILSSGDITTAFLKKRIKKEISIKTLGSTKSSIYKNKKINISKRILFIPSGEAKEVYFFTKFAFNFAKKYPEMNILIRFHPIVKTSKFINKLPKINNFHVSKSNIENDSKQSRYVIYSTSTAVFESILFGCMPIRLNWNAANDLSDPLWQLKSKLFKNVQSQDDLYQVINKNKYSEKNEIKLNQSFLKLNSDLEKLRSNLKKSVLYNFLKNNK